MIKRLVSNSKRGSVLTPELLVRVLYCWLSQNALAMSDGLQKSFTGTETLYLSRDNSADVIEYKGNIRTGDIMILWSIKTFDPHAEFGGVCLSSSDLPNLEENATCPLLETLKLELPIHLVFSFLAVIVDGIEPAFCVAPSFLTLMRTSSQDLCSLTFHWYIWDDACEALTCPVLQPFPPRSPSPWWGLLLRVWPTHPYE